MYRRLSNLRRLYQQDAWRHLNGLIIEPSAPWTTYVTASATMLLAQPPFEIFAHELIVVQMWVAGADAINLFHLPRREVLAWVETPAARHQSLPAQDFVQPGDASGE